MSGSLSVALYDLRADAKNELERLVRGKDRGSLKDQELRRRLYALDSLSLEPSCTLIMRGFREHKWLEDEWVSEPFYSSPQGYKMNVSVYANGNGGGYGGGYGSHVSVFVQLMWGEYDSSLEWPFKGKVTVELLNQQTGHSLWYTPPPPKKLVADFMNAPPDIAGRVASGEMNRGRGEQRFLPQGELEGSYPSPLYLKDDCLQFRVTVVTEH